ncbi:MAG: glycerol 3-phosphate dehydrogenase [Sulfobacillus thermosulfidooxidans]|uniref:Glycerol 3-phosphate dehydrogenase n=1 Tax=Sulfobacillus thermosulfidooxidans TaxID=28034 RepID=A0A2T2WS13_SULTH|nr:MAG: glycerol 3-phosphate dehydrogenase [Sulfobacillus thermosulfidooxidans]
MVIVVGAGATGLGIAWDLVLQGIPVTVIEQGDIGYGTSGRFHGLLHSGARYVVTDPVAAHDCFRENLILKRIAGQAIENTGGYFIQTDVKDNDYRERWEAGMQQAGIRYRPVTIDALRRDIGFELVAQSAYYVPDAVLEGFRLLQLLKENILAHGGHILTATRVTAIDTQGGHVNNVHIEGPTGVQQLACDVVVNAGGPWAGTISQMFDDPVSMQLSYGLMVIFANRHLNKVLNRLREPGVGDIFVPHRNVVILGTTDVAVEEPTPRYPDIRETLRLLQLGREMVPAIERWRVLRAFTGVRPLYGKKSSITVTRQVSRDFTIVNHAKERGPSGAFSVLGGKWTTFRLMAERCVDQVCDYLGVQRFCKTALVPLISDHPPTLTDEHDAVLCECEQVHSRELQDIRDSIDIWRTKTWFAMGPCQGTFCGHRVMAVRQQRNPQENIATTLQNLRKEREKGMQAAAIGANARQLALQRAVRFQTLNEPYTPIG